MSILQALAGRYERQVARGKAPEYGFSMEPVSFAVVLNPEGRPIDTMDLRDTSGTTPSPGRRQVPRPVVRSSNIRPNFLWDKTAYALGVKRDAQTDSTICAKREHDAFVSFHQELLAGVEDEGLRAFLAFLEKWPSDRYVHLPRSDDMLDANVVFCLEDGSIPPPLLHEQPEAREIWIRHQEANEDDRQLCLVTGERLPTAQTHPKIKGVRGAQSSGASIVSFNRSAFTSFGKKQGANAPVSERAAFAYTTALNSLLAEGRNRIRIGDTTTVFWAEAADDPEGAEAAEALFSNLLAPPAADGRAGGPPRSGTRSSSSRADDRSNPSNPGFGETLVSSFSVSPPMRRVSPSVTGTRARSAAWASGFGSTGATFASNQLRGARHRRPGGSCAKQPSRASRRTFRRCLAAPS